MGSNSKGEMHRKKLGVNDHGWDECSNRFHPSLCTFAHDMGLAYGKNDEIAADGDLLRGRLVSHCSSRVVVAAILQPLAENDR